MKLIITGSTGSAGAYLTRYFAEKGHEIIATGQIKTPPANLLKYATYIQSDITNNYELPSADACIHTAAYSDDKTRLSNLLPVNEGGTLNTLKAAKKCDKFIHISSSSVYLPNGTPLAEDMAGKQNNNRLSPYGLSKLLAEKVLIDNFKNEACFILRPRAHYGVGDKVILPRLLKLVKNEKLVCPGKMNIKISLTHYKNLAHAVECCLNSDKKGVHIYNVCDDKTYIMIDFIKKLTSSLFQKKLPTKHIPVLALKLLALFRINGITPLLVRSFTRDMVLDINKIKNELGYAPKAIFETELMEMVQWVYKIGGPYALNSERKELAWKV